MLEKGSGRRLFPVDRHAGVVSRLPCYIFLALLLYCFMPWPIFFSMAIGVHAGSSRDSRGRKASGEQSL